MRVPIEIVKSIWRRYAHEGRSIHERRFPDGLSDAIDLEAGPGGGSILRSDGYVFEWGWDDADLTRLRLADDHSAVQGLVIAGRRLPELKAALPARGTEAVNCVTCFGDGFVDFGQHPKAIVCHECDGLGWTAAEARSNFT
jgi:hypothetical protein